MVGTVRFGWARHGHVALNNNAYALLNAGMLKQFIAQNQQSIQGHCDLQDRKFIGPGHFFHSERLWRDDLPEKLTLKERHFNKVKSFFKPANRRGYLKSMTQGLKDPDNELDKDCCSNPDNVYQSIVKNYQDLVQQLFDAGSVKSLSKRKKAETAQAISETIGALSHYVGDMHQPMHVSLYYNWRVPVTIKNAHAFFENRLQTRKGYETWYAEIEKDIQSRGFKPEKLTLDNIKEELKEVLKSGFRAMFDVVAIDKTARENNGKDIGAYVRELRAGWQPIAKERMIDSSQLLASILNSAYEEAGRPSLNAVI